MEQDAGGDGGRREGADERTPARLVQPPATLPGGDAAADGREHREPEGDEESGAPEVGHVASLAVDGPWTGRLLR